MVEAWTTRSGSPLTFPRQKPSLWGPAARPFCIPESVMKRQTNTDARYLFLSLFSCSFKLSCTSSSSFNCLFEDTEKSKTEISSWRYIVHSHLQTRHWRPSKGCILVPDIFFSFRDCKELGRKRSLWSRGNKLLCLGTLALDREQLIHWNIFRGSHQ